MRSISCSLVSYFVGCRRTFWNMCSDQRKRIRRFISSDTGDVIFRDLRINNILVDALAPKVASASTAMISIDKFQNVNKYFISKKIHHVKGWFKATSFREITPNFEESAMPACSYTRPTCEWLIPVRDASACLQHTCYLSHVIRTIVIVFEYTLRWRVLCQKQVSRAWKSNYIPALDTWFWCNTSQIHDTITYQLTARWTLWVLI